MFTIIGIIIVGLIAGAVARFVVAGRDPMGLFGTMLLGIVGAFVGGTLWNLLTGGGLAFERSGLFGAVIGGVIALLVYRQLARA